MRNPAIFRDVERFSSRLIAPGLDDIRPRLHDARRRPERRSAPAGIAVDLDIQSTLAFQNRTERQLIGPVNAGEDCRRRLSLRRPGGQNEMKKLKGVALAGLVIGLTAGISGTA